MLYQIQWKNLKQIFWGIGHDICGLCILSWRLSHYLSYFSNFAPYFVFAAGTSRISTDVAEKDVLTALSQIIDPDFGTDIVSCGFVKDLHIDETLGEVIKYNEEQFLSHWHLGEWWWYSFDMFPCCLFQVSFRLELTTPACPVKDMVNEKWNTTKIILSGTALFFQLEDFFSFHLRFYTL